MRRWPHGGIEASWTFVEGPGILTTFFCILGWHVCVTLEAFSLVLIGFLMTAARV